MNLETAEEIFVKINGPTLSASRCIFDKYFKDNYLQLSLSANKYKCNIVRIFDGYDVQFIKVSKPKYNHKLNTITPPSFKVVEEINNQSIEDLKDIFNDLFTIKFS